MNKVIKVIIRNLITNVFLVIVKISSGLIFNSTALVADGIHSLSDLITDFVALFGEEIAKSKKGRKKTIFEDKTGLIVGGIVAILAIFLIIQSFKNEKEITSIIVVYISIFVILVKIFIVNYVRKMSKKLNNSILLSSAEESTTDIITSIIALIAILLSMFAAHIEIFKYADFVGGIIIGVITLIVGINIMFTNEKKLKKLE